MDICHLFLKKELSQKGFTLGEILTVIAILGIFATITYSAINPQEQIRKSRDAKRKSDLDNLKKVFEDYYNDNKSYPPAGALNVCGGTGLVPYIPAIPCDPSDQTKPYTYVVSGSSTYWIYTKLENTKDPSIAKVGCSNGCYPDGGCANYNYGVSSSNVKLAGCP